MFKPPSFKPALSFNNRIIEQFGNRIMQQRDLLRRVRAALPEALATKVRHCVVTDRRLLLYTDSAAWAGQLRFYSASILAAAAPISKESVLTVRIKLLLEQTGPSLTQAGTANHPSPAQLETLRNLSFVAPEDELTLALRKLAGTLDRLTSRD